MPLQIGHEALIPNPGLQTFAPFIGEWKTEGTHPMVPGVTFHGRTSFDWHEGGTFVVMRTEIDEPQIPSGISVFGSDDEMETLSMIYFDERKVARRYEAKVESDTIQWWRTTPSFSQRFTVTLDPDGKSMRAVGEMSRDSGAWEADLGLTYQRVS